MLNACATVPVVTTSAQCANAQASVDAMNQTFLNLGSPSQYAASVQSITQSLAAQMPDLYSYAGIGIAMCATVFQIGIQADLLTNQMLRDAGQSPVSGPTCLDATALPLGGFALGIGTIVFGLVALFVFIEARESRS